MTSMTERARSFDAWAPDYDRYRPTYPDALFDEIATRFQLPARPLVVDLGAGTGRATLAMAERGWRVTAVEPGKPMLDVLRARAAGLGLAVTAIEATAEVTGLAPDSAELVTAAQAFHWFDKQRALAEMARIVRPGGGVALFWNVRDEDRSPFVAEYHTLLAGRFGDADTGRYLQAGRATGRAATGAALAASESFTDPQLVELHHELAMTPDEFVGMAFTASYVRSLAPQEQATFRDELLDLLGQSGAVDGSALAIPYRIDLWVARRRAA